MNPANQAPRFGKIEINFHDVDSIVYEDCGMYITGNRLVIVKDKRDSVQNTQTSEGIIYDLSKVKSYITHQI